MNVFLVRHASAGMSNHLDPSDIERPLDTKGVQQASIIANLIISSDLGALFTSPALRCKQTLGPLSRLTGLEIVDSPSLFEGTDIDRSWAFLETSAHQHNGSPIVLCSHGDVIPELISRARMRGMSIPGKSGFSKGSIWMLNYDGENFTTGIYQSVKIPDQRSA